MVYVRGHERDFDTWAELGNTGWDFKSVLPYFKKSEDNTERSTVNYRNGYYHGVGGLLTVGNYSTRDPFIDVARSAFSQIGVKQIPDYNSGEHIGFVEIQGTIRNGERVSAATAFILPFKSRRNLQIMKGSQVNKILFSGFKAIGVNVLTTNKYCENMKLYATKEVVISAGAINSPKILLQSGIGRLEDLRPFGIRQVRNLAVGENFQDHPAAIFFLKANPNAATQNLGDLINDAQEYIFKRTGVFATQGSTTYHGFVNTLDPNSLYPDAQIIFNRFPKAQEELETALGRFGFKDEFIAQISKFNKKSELIFVYVNLMNPKSTGTVKLTSSNNWDTPRIVSGFLTEPEDVETLVRVDAKLRELVNTAAMRLNSVEIAKFEIPECDPLPYPSEPYTRCYLTYLTQSGYHPAGTCKMGPASDLNAVVDERLKVYGLQNLRVADASIMPNVISANTQATVYMIGEKAADMIKEDWSRDNRKTLSNHQKFLFQL